MNSSPPTTFVLNGVTADVSRETLRDQFNRTIAVRHQTFAVFRHLLENADRVITKDELMTAVWNGLAVTDDSLVQCIHEIRAALTTVARPSCRQCRRAVTGWSFPQMPDQE